MSLANRGAPLIQWGVSTITLAGHQVCGDQHMVKLFGDQALVAVVDGLGHGDEAAAAASAAIATLERFASEPVISLVRRCHQQLRKTRGAVMSLASFNGRDNRMTWLGVGNVEGVLLRQDQAANPAREAVLMRGGIVGYLLPPLKALTTPVSPGD